MLGVESNTCMTHRLLPLHEKVGYKSVIDMGREATVPSRTTCATTRRRFCRK